MIAYEIIVNVPGYMPEAEPYTVIGWREALDALKGELEQTFDTDPRDATEAELVTLLSELDRLRYEAPRLLVMQFGPYAHTLDRA